MKLKTTGAAIALSLGLGAAANAAVVVGMNSITYTGTGVEFFTDENHLIDGTGLSAAPTVANIGTITHGSAGSGNAWVTDAPNGGAGDYFSPAPGTVVFEIVFDNTYDVTDFYNWGYNFGASNNNNAKDFTIEYGVGNFASSLGTVTVARPVGNASANVATVFTADRVRLTVTDNYFGEAGAAGGDRVGLAEVRFLGDVAVIPEPSSTALLGLGGLALILRRRK